MPFWILILFELTVFPICKNFILLLFKSDSIVFSASITNALFSANKILIRSSSLNSFKNISKPILLETNDISRIVVINPPELTSCPEYIFSFLISSCIKLNTFLKYLAFKISFDLSPILLFDCINAEPPRFKLHDDISM